jgi:hypothetical protein
MQLMATENAAERHTTTDEEVAAVAMNWQSDNFDNNESDNSGSYENPEDELGYLLQKRGLKKVQINETLIIFLRKRYGSVVVSYTIIIIVACGTLNLLIQFIGSQS